MKGCEMAVSAVSMETSRGSASRLLPLGGAAFVVLVVVAFAGLSGNTPGAADSAATINTYYDAHHGREIIAALLIAAAAPLLVLFGMSLAAALWPTDAGRRPFWQIALAGASALAGTTWIIAAFIHFALADAADQHGMAGSALQTLNVLDADSWVAFNTGMGVLLLAAAGALLARRVHAFLGWTALGIGILCLIPYADFPGLILSGLWVIAMSIVLYRRGPAFAST
jgi:hypothetical protein